VSCITRCCHMTVMYYNCITCITKFTCKLPARTRKPAGQVHSWRTPNIHWLAHPPHHNAGNTMLSWHVWSLSWDL
jgi:hypothetical protein